MKEIKAYECGGCRELYTVKALVNKCEKYHAQEIIKKEKSEIEEAAKVIRREYVANNCSSLSQLSKLIEEHIARETDNKQQWNVKFSTFNLPKKDNYEKIIITCNVSAKLKAGNLANNEPYFSDWLDHPMFNKKYEYISYIHVGMGGGGESHSSSIAINLSKFPLLKEKAERYIELRNKEYEFVGESKKALILANEFLYKKKLEDKIILDIKDQIKYANKIMSILNDRINNRLQELQKSEEYTKIIDKPKPNFDRDELNKLSNLFC